MANKKTVNQKKDNSIPSFDSLFYAKNNIFTAR